MAISSYTSLKAAVADWLDRTDLTDQIPDFIGLAEIRHRRDFKIRSLETRVTANTVADQEYYNLPADYISARNIQLNTNPKTSLEYLTPEQMDRIHAGSSKGKPKAYSIIGNDLQLRPTPDSVYEIELLYHKYAQPLSDTNQSNEILANHPDVYLYGALYFASTFIRGMDQGTVAQFKTQYEGALQQVKDADALDKYNGAPLVQRSGINLNNFDNVK